MFPLSRRQHGPQSLSNYFHGILSQRSSLLTSQLVEVNPCLSHKWIQIPLQFIVALGQCRIILQHFLRHSNGFLSIWIPSAAQFLRWPSWLFCPWGNLAIFSLGAHDSHWVLLLSAPLFSETLLPQSGRLTLLGNVRKRFTFPLILKFICGRSSDLFFRLGERQI